jgi:hypothetical protein
MKDHEGHRGTELTTPFFVAKFDPKGMRKNRQA